MEQKHPHHQTPKTEEPLIPNYNHLLRKPLKIERDGKTETGYYIKTNSAYLQDGKWYVALSKSPDGEAVKFIEIDDLLICN